MARPLEHGCRALEERGPASLAKAEDISRLAELRIAVATKRGRVEIRQELAARLALLVELGSKAIMEQHATGANIWGRGPLARWGFYVSLLARILRDWPSALDDAVDVDELVAEALRDAKS